ncbi:MAG: putative lipid II flippase FtsW [Candidatus Magasanikbacteria bacterium]|nr:putative lipid II flippase FtsW [Candidatus Magasanikbacteria bacterium]
MIHHEETKKTDYVLISYFAILLIFGLIMLTSASTAVGHERFGDANFFIKRQILYGVIPGLFLFLFFAKLSYKKLKILAPFVYIFIILMLLGVFIPGLGSSFSTGANSWIVIAGISFQPAEFAKLGLIIFMAWYLTKDDANVKSFRKTFLPAVLLGLIPIGLVVLQPDIGTVSILFMILLGILFVAGSKISHLSLITALGVAGLIVMILIAPYRAARLTTFLHPELDPQGIGYHINQAYLAIGSGGLFGLGLGHSRQKFQYLPEVHADSIYAIIAEEAGFFFAVGLIILLIMICGRSLKLAARAPDDFAKLLVAGIIIWFISQSFLNIGAMVGLLPLTGVPLPFISHGGTALMTSMAAVGIIINISKYKTRLRNK